MFTIYIYKLLYCGALVCVCVRRVEVRNRWCSVCVSVCVCALVSHFFVFIIFTFYFLIMRDKTNSLLYFTVKPIKFLFLFLFLGLSTKNRCVVTRYAGHGNRPARSPQAT